MEWKGWLEPHKLHKKLGNFLELIEDIIVLILVIFIFIISLVALYDIGIGLIEGKGEIYNLLAKFIYIFILIEIFRLTIIYLKERRIDTSLMVKTTLIAVLREIIIKAPHFKMQDYIGVSILTGILALAYYIPKYIFVSEKKFELRREKNIKLKKSRMVHLSSKKKDK